MNEPPTSSPEDVGGIAVPKGERQCLCRGGVDVEGSDQGRLVTNIDRQLGPGLDRPGGESTGALTRPSERIAHVCVSVAAAGIMFG